MNLLQATVLQQELNKAQKTIDKSKKLAEVQRILSENDSLQRKLLAQEEDFRLQNQTLLNELSLVSYINVKYLILWNKYNFSLLLQMKNLKNKHKVVTILKKTFQAIKLIRWKVTVIESCLPWEQN